MSRALLILAMLVSLWPVGAFAALAATDSSSTTDTESESSIGSPTYDPTTDEIPIGPAPPAQPKEPQLGRLARLERRLDAVLEAFDSSPSLHGTPDTALAQRAQSIAAAFGAWRSDNSGRGIIATEFAAVDQRLARRLSLFAAAPSQDRLDRFNQAGRSLSVLVDKWR